MKNLQKAHDRVVKAERNLQDAREGQAVAASQYEKLVAVASQVFSENGSKRMEAVNIAASLIDAGYSLRSAAEAAGQEPNNKLQRYFTVARQMVRHAAQEDGAIAPPEGFSTWMDAVAAESL